MKLRLPNKLIAAIMAAASPVLFSTLSTATLGAAAVATLGQQAMGGESKWSIDHETSNHPYYYLDGAVTEIKTLLLPDGTNGVPVNTQGYTPDYTVCGIVAGAANQGVSIGEVQVANNQKLLIAQNPWGNRPNISLSIDTLSFASPQDSDSEYGGGSLQVNENQTVTLNAVHGTLTNLTNNGTLTLNGSATVSNTLSLGSNSSMTINQGATLTYAAAANAAALEAIFNRTRGDGSLALTIGGGETEMYGKNFAFNVAHTTITGTGGTSNASVWRINSNNSSTKVYNIGAAQSLSFSNASFRLEGDTTMNVSGALTITNGSLQLGHTDAGGHYGRLNILEGAKVSVDYFQIQNNTVATDDNRLTMTGGTLEIKGEHMFTSADSVTVNLSGGTLVAKDNSWDLNRDATIGAVTLQTTGTDAKITLGATGKTLTYAGTVNNLGNVGLAGNAEVDMGKLGKLELSSAGTGVTYNGTGDYAGSGYLVSFTDRKYYLIKGADGSTLSGSYTTLSSTATGTTLTGAAGDNGSYLVTMTQTGTEAFDTTTYYVNKELTYAASVMSGASAFYVSSGNKFKATTSGVVGKEVILESGATLNITGADNKSFANQQMQALSLWGDATLDPDCNFGLIGANGTGDTSLTLRGHTLTVDGGRLALYNTHVDAGVIKLTGGTVLQTGHSGGPAVTLYGDNTVVKIASGSLQIGNNSTMRLGGLQTEDGVSSSIAYESSNHSLVLDVESGEAYTFKGNLNNGTLNITTTGAGSQTFNLTANSNVGNLSVNAGTLAFDGSSTLTLNGDIANSGTLTMATAAIGGRTVNLSGAGSTTITTLNLNNGAVLNNNGSLSVGLANITDNVTIGGTSEFNWTTKLQINNNATLNVAEGTTLKGTNNASIGTGSRIILAQNSVLDYSSLTATQAFLDAALKQTSGDGTLKLKSYSTNVADSNVQMRLSGRDYTLGANVKITNAFAINNYGSANGICSVIVDAGKSLTVSGDMRIETLAGLTAKGNLTVNGTLTFGHPQAAEATFTIEDGAHVKVGGFALANNSTNKVLTMNGGTFEFTNTQALDITGSATINLLGGSLKASGAAVTLRPALTVGDVTLESGTVSLTGNIALTGTLTNKGTLTLGSNSTSTLEMSGKVIGENGTFVDNGVESVNGFMNLGESGKVYFVKNVADGATATWAGASTATVNGNSVTIGSDDDGLFVTGLTDIEGVYFVNEGTAIYDTSDTSSSQIATDATKGISLTGGTLVMNSGLRADGENPFQVINVSSSHAQIQLNEGADLAVSKLLLTGETQTSGIVVNSNGSGALLLTGADGELNTLAATTGTANVKATADVTVNADVATAVTGTLSVVGSEESPATLTLQTATSVVDRTNFSSVIIGEHGKLAVANPASDTGALKLNKIESSAASAEVNIAASSKLHLVSDADYSFAGVLTGSGTEDANHLGLGLLDKIGTGTLTLQGNDAYRDNSKASVTVVLRQGGLAITDGYVKLGSVQAKQVGVGDNVQASTVLSVGAATGNAATLEVKKLEFGDVNNQNVTSTINVNKTGTLLVTGNVNSGAYKVLTLMMGEWNTTTEVNVQGAFVARDAVFYMGDGKSGDGKTSTLNIDGGVTVLKGINRAKSAENPKLALAIANEGKLILGSTGIQNVGSNFTATVNNGTIGMTEDTSIVKDVAVGESAVFDTKKYSVSDAGVVTQDNTTSGTISLSGNVTTAEGRVSVVGGGAVKLTGNGSMAAKTVQIDDTSSLKSGDVATIAHHTNNTGDTMLTGATVTATGISKTAGAATAAISNAAVTVTGQDYSINAVDVKDSDIVVNGGSASLSNSTITMTHAQGEAPHTNTIDGVAMGENVSVNVAYGDTLQFLHQSAAVNLNDMFIGSGAKVEAYIGAPTPQEIAAAQNGTSDIEQTIAVSGTLTAKANAHLNANLTLNNGATLDIADATTGTKNGLTMGSSVTIAQDAKINLSDNIINGLNSLTIGEGLTLFSGVDAFNINGAAYNADTTYHASDFFNLSNSDVAVTRPWDFVVKFGADDALRQSGSGQSIFLYMETPEPATATLSLLALAALAARRRRK